MSKKGRKAVKTINQLEKDLKDISIQRNILKIKRELDELETHIEGIDKIEHDMKNILDRIDIQDLRTRLDHIAQEFYESNHSISNQSEKALNNRIKILRSHINLRKKRELKE